MPRSWINCTKCGKPSMSGICEACKRRLTGERPWFAAILESGVAAWVINVLRRGEGPRG